MNPSPPHPSKKSGFRTALQYTGIPPSWLDKRPRLPSRNWLIFLSVTQSLIALYAYDRHQSRKIRQEYVDRVKHLAEDPLQSHDFPRTVTVYGAKWPGDEDWDRAPRYFRKYVKVCRSRLSQKSSFTHPYSRSPYSSPRPLIIPSLLASATATLPSA
jgi:mitochondrial import inner membrane translocase subunit TIM54